MRAGLILEVIAMIGVILLIGIVKKNAILMIDVALQTQRRGRSAGQSHGHRHALDLARRPVLDAKPLANQIYVIF